MTAKGNNVIGLEIDKGCERRYSENHGAGAGCRDGKEKGKNAMKGKATDPNVRWYRPLIIRKDALIPPATR